MASGRHCVLIEGVFTLYPRKKHYLVVLKRSSLTYSPVGNEWGEINNGSYLQTATSTYSSWDPVINNSTDQENDAINPPLANNSENPTGVTSTQQTLTANVGPNNHPQAYHITNNNQKNNHNNNYNDNNNHYNENKRPIGDFIHLSDVVGCHCFKGKTSDDPRAYFTVYAYPFKKKILSGRKIRHRISVTFGVFQFEIFEDNLRIAEKWKNLIVYLARGKPALNLEGKLFVEIKFKKEKESCPMCGTNVFCLFNSLGFFFFFFFCVICFVFNFRNKTSNRFCLCFPTDREKNAYHQGLFQVQLFKSLRKKYLRSREIN